MVTISLRDWKNRTKLWTRGSLFGPSYFFTNTYYKNMEKNKMTNENEEKWLIGSAMKAHDEGDFDKAICLGLCQGDGWWRKYAL